MKFLLSISLLLMWAVSLYAQTDSGNAPVEWKRYKVSDESVSILLPKVPMVVEDSDRCNDISTKAYYAYAEGAVYEMKISRKWRMGDPDVKCLVTIPAFGASTLEGRLAELRSAMADPAEVIDTIYGRPVKILKSTASTRWIIDESARGERWIELAVHHYRGEQFDGGRFVKSMQFSAGEGADIQAGAAAMIGDPMPPVSPSGPSTPTTSSGSGNGSGSGTGAGGDGKVVTVPTTKVITPYQIVLKLRPGYTEAARRSETQGTTMLRVILLSNGRVGSISVVRELPDGITEQAIAAARRLVFLPKRVHGVPASISVMVEYSFSIY